MVEAAGVAPAHGPSPQQLTVFWFRLNPSIHPNTPVDTRITHVDPTGSRPLPLAPACARSAAQMRRGSGNCRRRRDWLRRLPTPTGMAWLYRTFSLVACHNVIEGPPGCRACAFGAVAGCRRWPRTANRLAGEARSRSRPVRSRARRMSTLRVASIQTANRNVPAHPSDRKLRTLIVAVCSASVIGCIERIRERTAEQFCGLEGHRSAV